MKHDIEKEQSEDLKNLESINGLPNTKKYGLILEEHAEKVEKEM